MHSYFFVRQDISPEQQTVQLQHVSLELGNCLTRRETLGLNFVTCGVPDLEALENIESYLVSKELEYVLYRDSHFLNEITAIATFPICAADRPFFRFGKLLRFK
jgi:hypothetical protein